MSNRFEALVDALEHTSINAWQQLEQAKARIRALEAENRVLRSRIEALAPANASSNARVAEAPTRAPASEAADPETPLPSSAPAEHQEESVHSQPDEVMAASDPKDVGAETPTANDDALYTPHSLLEEWYSRFPAAFFKGHTKPLQVGIHTELARHYNVSTKLLRRALACYVNLPRYLKSIREGRERVDLHGKSCGVITQEEAAHALTKLEGLQSRQKERQARAEQERMNKKLSALANHLQGH
ncbi:ProQ/FINO family protein [Larsenimonas suaedae]|uniref:ProQ/FINO family protein n=1 Tax=Larsenimonas suaedae TaxID=1851019 RepID=A0ABU1GWE7_9GAMM|nr:ProQ/FINO family protein [Larsenimonas suaedae]MCM2972934.1 ProQ/FINO family protein [Larsenimonas suaedae]MDR5896371.1 ProQ/FINO family protein [Larsenimonas suaedae]